MTEHCSMRVCCFETTTGVCAFDRISGRVIEAGKWLDDADSADFPREMQPPVQRECLPRWLDCTTHVSLALSEHCNLACRYCYDSHAYPSRERAERSEMERTTALAAVDYLFHHCAEAKLAGLTFYGGEPLLRWDLVTECVEYARQRDWLGKLRMGVTTNGTLLTPDKVRFLARNRIQVGVSLDGPQDIHDRYRVFPDGSGTWECVMANLRAAKAAEPEWYEQYLFFQPVVTRTDELDEIAQFFGDSDVVHATRITARPIAPGHVGVEPHPSLSGAQLFGCIKTDAGLCSCAGERASGVGDICWVMSRQTYRAVHTCAGVGLARKVMLSRLCVPGYTRLFVRADGRLYPCHMGDVNGDAFCIGHLDDGVDGGRVWRLIEHYVTQVAQDCGRCWALPLCSLCYAYAFEHDTFDLDRHRDYCERYRSALRVTLAQYSEVMRDNPVYFYQ